MEQIQRQLGVKEKAEVVNAVNELRALGDALATMPTSGDTVNNLGYLIVQKADKVGLILEVL